MQVTNGLSLHRCRCMMVLGVVFFASFVASDLQAEMISAVEKTGSTQLRGMIEDSGPVFDRLLRWAEFGSVNVVLGAQANNSVVDVVDSREGYVNPGLVFVPVVAAFQGAASNSFDSSSSVDSVPQAYAAILGLRSAPSDPVLLLYWRGREFICIPSAPSSGLFRPPRQPLFDSAISSF